ncbi:hypothetical protein M405DRAFT_857379 [Rhizopogon salebrosus TDB-379]|nr:hypothetical protein M405DRAFT_857379 [Rhizopogon salebrosus TDB-379]
MNAFNNNQQPTTGFGANIFGGSGSGGATTNTTNPFGNTSGSSIFGNPSANAGSSMFGATPAAGSGPTTTAPSTPAIFGTTSTSKPTGSMFGTPSTTQPTNIFGPPTTTSTTKQPNFFATSAANTTSTSASNLFGAKPDAPQAAATSGTSAPATTTPNFSLGGATAGTSVPPAPSGGLFGAVPPKADGAEKKDAAAPTPALNIFGTKDTASEKKDAAAPAAGLFAPKPATPAATTFTGERPARGEARAPYEYRSGPSSSSANLFGAKPAVSTPAAPSDPTNLFGAKPAAAATATPAPLGLSALGQPKNSDKPKEAPAAATASVAVPPPSALRGKTAEEIVNKWSSELEVQVREFNKFAGEVAVWDRALMENGNNLATLFTHVHALEREQNDIDQSLDHIEQQQKDLSATLDAYERSAEELFGESGTLRALDTGPADAERDKNYMLATELHAHLDDLSGSLTQMIDSVNALSLTPNGSQGIVGNDDPMTQISQILSSHLDSLQWIDGAVREVEGKVNEVEKRVREVGGVSTVMGSSAAKSRGFGSNR